MNIVSEFHLSRVTLNYDTMIRYFGQPTCFSVIQLHKIMPTCIRIIGIRNFW